MLDARFAGGVPLLTDDDIDGSSTTSSRRRAWRGTPGSRSWTCKHCHGYLGHELLERADRPGRYGGILENRTRFLREIVDGIRADVPGL